MWAKMLFQTLRVCIKLFHILYTTTAYQFVTYKPINAYIYYQHHFINIYKVVLIINMRITCFSLIANIVL